MNEERMNKLRNDALLFGIELSDSQLAQFYTYYQMLIEWNKKINLTAITDFDEVLKKHFLDSLSIGRILNQDSSASILDIGTGAGFPGIPIKIAYPNVTIILMDSLNKRITFLNEVIQTLHLEKIDTIHGRAEDFSKNNRTDKIYRESFDICVSRAVANLSSLSEFCLPYVKVGGKFISFKSEKAEEELINSQNAISVLGGKNTYLDTFMLPGTDFSRTLVVIEKVKETPNKYPRKAGTPVKNPL